MKRGAIEIGPVIAGGAAAVGTGTGITDAIVIETASAAGVGTGTAGTGTAIVIEIASAAGVGTGTATAPAGAPTVERGTVVLGADKTQIMVLLCFRGVVMPSCSSAVYNSTC